MSFLNKSIEDSLKLINTNEQEQPPKRKRGRPKKKIANTSPVRVPQMSPVDKFSPFRTTSRPSSPIALQRSPEAQERIVPPVTPKADEADDEEEETVEQDIRETKDITSILKSKYFHVVRYIECNGILLYAVTYDPNGQVVYIELDGDDSASVNGFQTSHYPRKEYIEYPFSLKEYYKDKINGHIYGIVLIREENMCFLTKTDNGDVTETYYGNEEETGKLSCYCVFKLSDIEEDLEASLQSISYTYEMIQQHQLMKNKDSFKTAMEEIHKIYVYSQEFDKIYKKFTQSILDDWSRFSNVSVDYIDKLFEEGLTEEESNKFNHISNNLFARFQAFNNITNTISELQEIPATLLPIKTKLKESIEMFEKDNAKMSSKILDTTEIDVSI
jgi:hypothetical protein